MKIYTEKYPLGSFKGQKTEGIYCEEVLYENLKELSTAIVKDNSFLILVSSQALSVRTGKSTFTQLMAEAWNYIMLKEHEVKLDFDMRNIAFNADEFEKKSFALYDRGQRYAPVILDESDDLTGHSLSQEVKKIKRFLRKAGQLNLLMIMILPDFFEFPKSIAVNRSVCLITVDYENHFERGHFKFFDFKAKKKLYIKGKSFNDYGVQQYTFRGVFTGSYLVNEEEYRKEKYRDLFEDAQKEKAKNITNLKKEVMLKIFTNCVRGLKGRVTREEITTFFEMGHSNATLWLKELKDDEVRTVTTQI